MSEESDRQPGTRTVEKRESQGDWLRVAGHHAFQRPLFLKMTDVSVTEHIIQSHTLKLRHLSHHQAKLRHANGKTEIFENISNPAIIQKSFQEER